MKETRMIEIKTYSADDTITAGLRLGELLKKGDIVCLSGDLGTGKTALTNGIAKALGITGYITSPTFTIVNEYKAKIPFYHFDVYRIADPDEMFEIGFEEYIDGNGIVVIEWANLIKSILPEQCIFVEIKKDKVLGQDARVINIRFADDRYAEYERQWELVGKDK